MPVDDDSDFAPMAVLWDNKPQGFISIVLGSYHKEE
jgi:hypothetical protein